MEDKEKGQRFHLLFLGSPGSGKSTVAKQVAERYNLLHISSGDLLRELRESPTEVGEFLRENWSVGAVGDIALDLILQHIESTFRTAKCSYNGFILDGAPRTGDSAWELTTRFAERGIKVDAIIEFRITQEMARYRLLGRRLDSETGEILHVDELKSHTKDVTVRHDDTSQEDVENRLQAFAKLFKTVKNFFLTTKTAEGEKWPMHAVDAREDREKVLNNVLNIILQLPAREETCRAHSDNLAHCRKVGGIEAALVKNRIRKAMQADTKASSFPGSHPVSLTRNNITFLLNSLNSYVVGHKFDGERYMLYVNDDGSLFFLDRRLGVKRLTIDTSVGGGEGEMKSDWKEWAGTLLDGELLTRVEEGGSGEPEQKRIKTIRFEEEEKETEEKEKEDKGKEKKSNEEVVYIVLDVLSIKTNNVMNKGYADRMNEGSLFINFVNERRDAKSEDVVLWSVVGDVTAKRASILFSMHHCVPARDVGVLFKTREEGDVKGKDGRLLCLPKDGLVFQPLKDAYSSGYSKRIYKWKEPMENTIDFYLTTGEEKQEREKEKESESGNENEKEKEKIREEGQTMQMYVMGNNNRMSFWDYIYIEGGVEYLKGLEGRIGECFWDANEGRWRLLKLREDKTTPNAEWVANQIWRGIESGLVDEEELVALLSNHQPQEEEGAEEEEEYTGKSNWQQWKKNKGQKLGKRKRKNKRNK